MNSQRGSGGTAVLFL